MNNNVSENKVSSVSVVAPIALNEPGLHASSWRAASMKSCELRFLCMLTNFVKMFQQDDLLEFIIVCPSSDEQRLKELVSQVTNDHRYRVMDESSLLKVSNVVNPDTGKVSGWHVQQIIKLAMAEKVMASHYLTLDCDILCTRPFGISDLIVEGKVKTGLETLQDYQRLYSDEFAKYEMNIKQGRQRAAEKLLAWNYEAKHDQAAFSETPVLLKTDEVKALTKYLTDYYHSDWQTLLSNNLAMWTEYSLYFAFLAMSNKLADVCHLVDCNQVLNLEKSAWHKRSCYRVSRNYDVANIFSNNEGPFVAIQSWLQPEEWLPEGVQSADDFYREVLNYFQHELS